MYFVCRIYTAPPTAELEPLNQGQLAQTDEVNSLCVNSANIRKNSNYFYFDTYTVKGI